MSARGPARGLTRALVAAGALLALGVGGYWGARRALGAAGANAPRTQLTHDVVVQQVRAVAQLVTSEATVRDVVTYENTRYLTTKRALFVVTGRLLAGVALDGSAGDAGAEVAVDTVARRIAVTLPPARLLAVEVTGVRTYDERSGLLNPFTPADRDSLQGVVRARLVRTGTEMGLLRQAERNAATVLRGLLARDGYTVTVEVRGAGVVPAPAPTAPVAPVPAAPAGG